MEKIFCGRNCKMVWIVNIGSHGLECPVVGVCKQDHCGLIQKVLYCHYCWKGRRKKKEFFKNKGCIWGGNKCLKQLMKNKFLKLYSVLLVMYPSKFYRHKEKSRIDALCSIMKEVKNEIWLARRTTALKNRVQKVRHYQEEGKGERLFPLPDKRYDEWFFKIFNQWGEKKKISCKKQKISGIKFNTGGKVITNGKSGWDKVIYKRYIGAKIVKNEKGRARIEFLFPD